MEIRKDTLIDEKYAVVRELGRGGFAIVYEAKQVDLDRTVAVKLHITDDLMTKARLEREGLILSKLRNKNIVQVYAFGYHHEYPYLVMELVPGRSLQSILDERGRLPVHEAKSIFLQVLHGMACVHQNGIVHRDLKPENIVVGVDGSVRVIDFGLGKIDQPVVNDQKLTDDGTSLGTVAYMSPEACLGQTIDARSDVYSLGCVWYEMMTGKAPFSGVNAIDVMRQHLSNEYPTLAFSDEKDAMSNETRALLDRMLAKNPSDRFATAAEVIPEFESIAFSESVEIRRRIKFERQRTNKNLVGTSAAIAGAAVAVFALVYLYHPHSTTSTASSTDLFRRAYILASGPNLDKKPLIPDFEEVLAQDAKDHALTERNREYVYAFLVNRYIETGYFHSPHGEPDFAKSVELGRRLNALLRPGLFLRSDTYGAISQCCAYMDSGFAGGTKAEALAILRHVYEMPTSTAEPSNRTSLIGMLAKVMYECGDRKAAFKFAKENWDSTKDFSITRERLAEVLGGCELYAGNYAAAQKYLETADARMHINGLDTESEFDGALACCYALQKNDARFVEVTAHTDFGKNAVSLAPALIFSTVHRDWKQAAVSFAAAAKCARRYPQEYYNWLYDFAFGLYVKELSAAGLNAESQAIQMQVNELKAKSDKSLETSARRVQTSSS